MAVTPPPSLTAPPTAPDPNDRATFSSRAYALVSWLSTMVTQMTSALSNVYTNASEAYASGLSAAASAAAASASASAALHNPATNYATGAAAISNVNYLTYRRTSTSPGVDATDPANDTSGRWAPAGVPPIVLADVTGSITAQAFGWYRFTAAGDLTLPASPLRGDVVYVTKTASHVVTVLRNGKPIGGLADDAVLGTPGAWYALMYLDVATGWTLVDA